MEYYKIDARKPDPVSITRAVEVLKEGGVIVYPTDTLYGLGVDMTNQKAVGKLLHLKRRSINTPVSLMVESVKNIEHITGKISPQKKDILNNLLPGKVTVIVENKNSQQKSNDAHQAWDYKGKKKIGFRLPDHAVCRQLSMQLSKPISSTSANISGQDNALNIQDVISYFGNKLDLILDAGSIKSNLGSTVLDLTKVPFLIQREGEISAASLRDMIPGMQFEKRKPKFIVVFVCTGNICRSPLAEGIMKAMAEKTRFKDIMEIKSAGTLNLGPVPAHDFSIKVADDNEIDISSHRAKMISERLVEEASLIFCLSIDHLQYLREHYPQFKHKFHLLKDYGREKPMAVPSIADPIGHNLDVFRRTYSEIYNEVKRIFPSVLNELKKFMEYNDLVQKK